MSVRQLPDAWTLPRARYSGWACVWCGASLAAGGQSVGRASSARGAWYSVEVYECLPGHGCNTAPVEPPLPARAPTAPVAG